MPAFAIYSGLGKVPVVLVLTVVGGDTGRDPFGLVRGRAFGDCALACCAEGGGVMLLGSGGEENVDLSCAAGPRVGDLAAQMEVGGGVEGMHISTMEGSCASGI